MKNKLRNQYPLDNSAIIHLAVMRKEHTNSFRITAALTEVVCPKALQSALNHITPRFPTIVAGIRRRFFQYAVVPVETPPQVMQENEILSCMTKKEIRTCAIRVLYAEKQISIECFHSLTDGYGGSVFFNTLLAEYFSIQHSEQGHNTEQVCNPVDEINDVEVSDDFLTYAGADRIPANCRNTYRIPKSASSAESVCVTTGIYPTQELLDAAHKFGVTLTVFLTAVMFDAVMEFQKRHADRKTPYQPIQIMVPINLRKLFASKSLRNFSLYALPCIEPIDEKLPFEALISSVSEQIQEQTAKEHLKGLITTNVRTQKLFVFRILPLPVKDAVLRVIYHFYGERNSCLSLSNLGEIICPEEISRYIQQIDFTLSPRRDSSYNCGVVSFNGILSIQFSRSCAASELEAIFFERLRQIV